MMLAQKRDVEIEKHRILKLPQSACVPNQQHPYIMPCQSNRTEPIDLSLIASFRGVGK